MSNNFRQGISAIADNLLEKAGKLRELSIYNCNFTDDSVIKIANNLPPEMKYLRIEHGKEYNDEAVEAL